MWSGSGPAVARLFHRALALIFLAAWLSLGSQIELLVGSRGLLPAAELFAYARQQHLGLGRLPSLLWLAHGDGALLVGCWLGALLALAWLAGVRPRLLAALSTVLYLSYTVACRTFCQFQWDHLILECGALASLLPTRRPAPLAHLLLRLLLFKLYFESGIAKWQSAIGDWHDGSAMSFYYETAPLPARLGWYAHALPLWWHRLESWLTLGLELVVPFLAFTPRRGRLVAAVLLTGFQVLNAATANYGFFIHLALALHLLLLDDSDVERAAAWLRARLGRAPAAPAPAPNFPAADAPLAPVVLVYVLLSTVEGLATFGGPRSGAALASAAWLRGALAPFRVVNSYHLFAQITRDRVEPQLEIADAAGRWTELELHHKPGSPTRAPDYVAPHQPRVDFQLWFYGLGHRRGAPAWVATLLRRICQEPPSVQPLFATPLPSHPRAVRLRFWDYRFTTPAQRAATGAWWRREEVSSSGELACDRD